MSNREDHHQKMITRWRDLVARQHACLKWLFHVPNGGHRVGRAGQYIKAEGGLAGVSDWLWPYRAQGMNGLALELKRPDGGSGLSQDQFDFLSHMAGQGWMAGCVHGSEASIALIAHYYRGTAPIECLDGVFTVRADGVVLPGRVGQYPKSDRIDYSDLASLRRKSWIRTEGRL